MRLALFLALLLATPAFAGGDNVVMIVVAHVAVPQKLPGLCGVEGTISHVWEGHGFHEGQMIALNVPCGDEAAGPLPPATSIQGPRLTDPVVLKASTLGAAHIDDDGNLLWQPAGADREVIWGYRVLSPVRLRLGRSV